MDFIRIRDRRKEIGTESKNIESILIACKDENDRGRRKRDDNRKVRGGLEIALCMRRQVHSVITRINRINLVAHAGMTFISDTCLQQKQLYATRYLPRDSVE